jgi:Fe-Mn family superoxide dismutase
MPAPERITRKKALGYLTLGSASALLLPGLFTTSCATQSNGAFESYSEMFNETWPFQLSPLPYADEVFEPVIDAQTMNIHHGRHHQGYVNNLNNALEAHADLQSMTLAQLVTNLASLPQSVRTAVRNHGGGHLNHAIFWNTMHTNGGQPSGALAQAIVRDFGSVNALREQFAAAAGGVFGSGWAWLASNATGQLQIVQTPNQDNPLTDGLHPILGVDVWEHAYYLNYQNRRGDYVNGWWDLIYWDKVAELYDNRS